MRRITDPLTKMGAKIDSQDGKLPLFIKSADLKNSKLEIEIPSAQIKSGLILAALNTDGTTYLIENNITRNHTEIMLNTFEADIETKRDGNISEIKINGKKNLFPEI